MHEKGATGSELIGGRGGRAGRGRVRVLSKKRVVRRGMCLLLEDGRPCHAPIASRGICERHLRILRAEGRVAEFALPRRSSKDLRHRYRTKAEPEPGLCRLVVNDEPCARAAQTRGLCRRHYGSIHRRPDLSLDDFALPPVTRRSVRRRRKLVESVCRARENGVDCTAAARIRGLCRPHYRYLSETAPELFASIATPDSTKRRYALRTRPADSVCRVATDGVGCEQPVRARGLCRHHWSVLRRKPELFEAIALPPRTVIRTRFEQRPRDDRVTGECVVVVDGEPCTRPPQRRGVCAAHYTQIAGNKRYKLSEFLLPEMPSVLEKKAAADRADGLCQVVEDGAPCTTPPHVRGLCRSHYRAAGKRGLLDALARPPRNGPTRYGRGNDRPHVYLDKNVLFDHADHELFGAQGQAGSVALLRAAIAGDVRASVSSDGIKSTYNHARHRLERAASEGGRGLSPDESDAAARRHVRTTFFSGGTFRVIALDVRSFREVVGAPAGSLSLEDALELQAYLVAREARGGPTVFVTRDSDFPEGVHPTHVVRSFGL